jgi:hypothetical protein
MLLLQHKPREHKHKPMSVEPALAARKYKWQADSNAPETQIGFITVNFKLGRVVTKRKNNELSRKLQSGCLNNFLCINFKCIGL